MWVNHVGLISQFNQVRNSNISVIIVLELIKVAVEDRNKFLKSMIAAADFSKSVPNFLYSSMASHAPIIALDLLYNTILQYNNHTSNYTIKTSSHPISTSLVRI